MTTAAVSSSQGRDSVVHYKDAFLQAAISTQQSLKCKLKGKVRESLSYKMGIDIN